MNTDRLAEITWRARTRERRTGNHWMPMMNSDVLALVEIARAARVVADHFPVVQSTEEAKLLDALASALARLDSGAAEGDA